MKDLSTVSNLFLDEVLNNLAVSLHSLEGESILYIDDEYVNYLYFSEILSGTGAKILRAFTTNQALSFIAVENQVCLTIVAESFTWRMNNRIVSQVKNISPDMPVIGIFETDNGKSKSKFLQSGCDLYISRYIDNIHLVEMINELLKISDN